MAKAILIIDGSPMIKRFTSFGLENVGYKVLTASDGIELCEFFIIKSFNI